uniref:Uncharacterized protein n=1 Tax=Magallana gigas TaxID=29159 RepID=K1PJI3_MAGGI
MERNVVFHAQQDIMDGNVKCPATVLQTTLVISLLAVDQTPRVSISRFADDERYYSKYSSIVIIPAFLPMNIAGMKLVEDFENQNLPNNMEDTAKAVVKKALHLEQTHQQHTHSA